MPTEEQRAVVGVFDLSERAERTASQLVAEGYGAGQVRVVGPSPPPECAEDLVEGGATAEAGAYYSGEARNGRWLVIVSCRPERVAGVMSAFGRNGGSIRVPTEVRDGTA